MQGWNKPVSAKEAHCRAGGRRRYNARRQEKARRRLETVLNMLWFTDMTRQEMAQSLGVSESTISRDLRFKHRYNFTAIYKAGSLWQVKKPR